MPEEPEFLSFDEAMRRIADEHAPLSSHVIYALSASGSTEARLFGRQWPSIAVERRREVIASLAESAEANYELDFNALFRLTMKDEDPEVRTVSIEGLWEDEEAALVRPLVDVLRHDPAAPTRAAAATSLGRFALMADLDELEERYATLLKGALFETVRHPSEPVEVRRRAVESIAYLGDECVKDIITQAYQDADERMRMSAVFAMGRSVDRIWSETVLKELANANPAMRYEAARACGELEVKDAVPTLVRLTADPDREVQAAAIAALGHIGGPQAQRTLERYCRSKDEVLRTAAEDALAELELGQQPLDLLAFDPAEGGLEDEIAGEDDDLDSED
jgi:HEAT repeat protein